MKKVSVFTVVFLFLSSVFSTTVCTASPSLKIVEVSANQIDVLVDGRLFTSYRSGLNDEKPIFFPVNSPQGQMLNRGWPIVEGIDGESTDHIHHQGLFFTYGDVNGLDFWAEPKDSLRNGKIVHRKLLTKNENNNQAEIILLADWLAPDGSILLNETKKVTFFACENYRAMDFDITVTAAADSVHFGDTKEGWFGLRVTPQLMDDNDGEFLNSDGLKTAVQCWGKRAKWCALRGPVNNEKIVLAIFVHPGSLNFPPFWHARGYGLFTANPLGRGMYTKGQEAPLELTLTKGESLNFKARLMIFSGEMTQSELEQGYDAYVGE